MIKQLIKVASELDAAGFTKEADQVDAIIRKIAGQASWSQHQWNTKGDSFDRKFTDHKRDYGGASLEETVAYNKEHGDKDFDPKNVSKETMFWLRCNGCGP